MSDNRYPSLALARVVGPAAADRGALLLRVLSYADAQGLREPGDLLTINLDDSLRAVFGRQQMTVAEIYRDLSHHTV